MSSTEELSQEEKKIVEEVRQGTLEILQDALKKKDKVLMKIPERIVLQGEEKEQVWMKRYAILTEDAVKKLLAKLKTVTFKKRNMCEEGGVALVRAKQEPIYLCKPFWECQKYLGKYSQPGTIIHEVSHLLGASDYNYEKNILYVGCKGSIVKDSPEYSTYNTPSDEKGYVEALKNAFWNAENITREFELTICHKGGYENGRYSCCGETKRYSVCENSVPYFFHTCNIGKTWMIEKLKIKDIIQRSSNIPSHLRRLHEIEEEMDKSLRNKVDHSIELTERELVPASLAKFLWDLKTSGVSPREPLAASPSLLAAAMDRAKNPCGFFNIFRARAPTLIEELYAIFDDCQSFLYDFERVRGSLSYRGEILRDSRQETKCHTYLVTLPVLITLIKEEMESPKKDDGQKMHMLLTQFQSYMAGVLESIAVLECLYEHIF